MVENNDILMYSIHNEGKSVIAERFIKTLKAKIYKKMTANDKLVDQYDDTYHHSIGKKPNSKPPGSQYCTTSLN